MKSSINISDSFGAVTYKGIIDFANKVYAIIQAIIDSNIKYENNSIVKEEQKSNDGLEQLEKLAELKAKGIITEEEFEESKKKILARL